jgi:hypothetical protein
LQRLDKLNWREAVRADGITSHLPTELYIRSPLINSNHKVWQATTPGSS